MRRLATLAAVVGFISAALGLYQAFAMDHLAQIAGYYECRGGGETNLFEFLRDLDDHAGEVVMLQLQMCAFGFNRHVTEGSVVRRFEGETFLEAVGIEPSGFGWKQGDWDRVTPIIEDKLSGGNVTLLDVSWDNGIGLVVVGAGQTSNPYSSVTLGSEGSDQASGPFQISKQNTGESFTFVLSPAPVTDRLAAQVRCARRVWPKLVRFAVCPFF
ncbi:MAG: hypothetical protein L0387_39645 [Acidobacteria bacterium]|nr:hypothetical protein [Acidobacteriota bacterium]